ncbi:phage tail tape measure protein [Streptomyces sp. NPDC007910]|uniref:phage tail tape measure protein n=1 Tax=Streptomyces sp. NPDC007910 TaxID=3364790 RepID=UPI0036F09755
MALTVGELNAVLSIDDRTVEPALRRAEEAVRATGQRMGDDIERAGQEAGENLGDGIARGADGRLRNARGRFVAAGRNAGEAVGDGLTDAAADGADQAVEETGGRLERLKMLAAGAGLAAGAALVAGIQETLNQGQITARLGAQLGATGPEAAKYGKIAGQLFKDAIVVDFQQGADVIRSIAGAGLLPPQATNAQIQSIATKAADLANAFEVDVAMAANAAGAMVKNGLAKNSTEAFDLLTKGMTGLGPASDDLLETFGEYSPVFKQAGISGQTALGLMRQAIQGGWVKDTDKIGDAFKELQLRATEGSEGVSDAMEELGLDAKKVGDDIAAGGTRGEKAMGLILDKLRKLGPDTQAAKQVVSTLFGGPGEDLGAALFALNMDKASKSVGNVSGAADKLGNSLRDNAATNLTQFKNAASQAFVDFLGGQAIPALIEFGRWMKENEGTVKVVASVIGGVLAVAFTMMAINATRAGIAAVQAWFATGTGAGAAAARHVAAAGTVVASWLRMAVAATAQGARIVAVSVASAARSAAAWVANAARMTVAWAASMIRMAATSAAQFALIAASAVTSAATTAAVWAASAARMTATWLVSMLRVAATTVAQFALMAGRAIVWAATMAAQWLIAMGPIGWVIAAVIGLVALIVANWDKIKKYTQVAWDWLWQKIKGIGQFILDYFLGWKLVSYFLSHWDRIKSGVASKASALLGWFKGLPGRLASALGNLGSLLYDKGMNVVQGLWNGIQSMGGWIKGKLISWAKSMIPGPIAKALGIASPSKVTKEQGKWIARGLVVGLTGNAKQVQAAATKLADIVRDSMKPGKKRDAALKTINQGTGRLLALANAEAKLATRMKAANQRLADLLKARSELAGKVKEGILDAANITQGTENGVTATSILAGLDSQLKRAKQFAENLNALRRKGVRADLIAQIAEAGVEQGSATAAALAAASSGQVKQINSTQAQLVTAAGKAGATAGDAMYGTGIRVAQGLVKGLQSQQRLIEAQMLSIAKSMEKAIKKALGIKSPSRVMAAVGQYIPAGLVRGIEAGRSAVDASMASLVTPPSPALAGAGAYGVPGPGARGRGQAPTVLEIRSGGSRLDDLLVELLRGAVKARGGDVQLVLGKRS